MKNDTLLLIGAGIAAYLLLKPKNAPTTSGGDDYSTPLGFTSTDVQRIKEAGGSNSDAINAALNQPPSYTVISSKGKSRTISSPPVGATKTSLNKNQYLAPRAGGGYSVVGARNITLR